MTRQTRDARHEANLILILEPARIVGKSCSLSSRVIPIPRHNLREDELATVSCFVNNSGRSYFAPDRLTDIRRWDSLNRSVSPIVPFPSAMMHPVAKHSPTIPDGQTRKNCSPSLLQSRSPPSNS